MSEMVQTDAPVAIIGYGTAGVNAAIALRNSGYDGVIRVFSDITTLPYSPILTSYYAGGEKSYEECFPWSAEELAELDVDVLEGNAVTELDPETHVVRTAQGDFPYSKCVIATGATPMTYGFPSDCGYDPLVLRSMDDAERLKGVLEDESCKRVLVSGASMVALKTLEACLDRGKQVTLVGMNPHVLDFNALPEAAERFEKGLVGYGVELRLGQTIANVKRVDRAEPAGERTWQLEVTFSNGDVDRFDEISVSHGMKSNLDFVKPGSLEIDHGVVVDDFMRTSNPDVYAAGDVAQATELISGEKRIVGIWKNAALQGACAGAAIAAELAGRQPDASCAYAGGLSMNTIQVKDTLFISSGTIELTPTRQVEVRETEDMTVVYIFEECAGVATAGADGVDGAANADRVASADDGKGSAGADDGKGSAGVDVGKGSAGVDVGKGSAGVDVGKGSAGVDVGEGSAGGKNSARRLVGFNLVSDHGEEGGVAYDTGAMLTLRIEAAFRNARNTN